ALGRLGLGRFRLRRISGADATRAQRDGSALGARHQKRIAVLAELAPGKAAHALHRAAEGRVAGLVDVEARRERHAFQRGAPLGRADLARVPRQARMANRAVSGELDRTRDGAVMLDFTGAACTVDAGEGEELTGDELAGLFGGS